MSWQSQLLRYKEKHKFKRKRKDILMEERDKLIPFRPKKDQNWDEYLDLSNDLVDVDNQIDKMECNLRHPMYSILIPIFSQDIISILLEYDSFCCCSSCFALMPKTIKYCLPCLFNCCLQIFEFALASFHTLNQEEWFENELEMYRYVKKYVPLPFLCENTHNPPFLLFLYFVRGTNQPLRLIFK
jgi:hypothetical protein